MSTHKPNQSEIEILQSLWDRETATVREMYEDVLVHRSVGYTTTLKQVQRMELKGMVERVAKSGRAHQYRSLIPPINARQSLIKRLVDSAFGGSTGELVLHALGNEKPNADEIREIRNLLNKLDEE